MSLNSVPPIYMLIAESIPVPAALSGMEYLTVTPWAALARVICTYCPADVSFTALRPEASEARLPAVVETPMSAPV
ncbi:hypothetical protein D3C81_2156230 [compost metagenome]